MIGPLFRIYCAGFFWLLAAGCAAAEPRPVASVDGECVILLHGLARTSKSMEKMASALEREGFRVINVDYPSRHYRVEKLVALAIPPAINDCEATEAARVHFVTHSLGGILVRYHLSRHELPRLGRVVMLSPPNQGSEVVDKLKNWPGFYWINGPAGEQLGTDINGIPARLPPVDYPVGVITGDRSINWINSMLIPGRDDGKVSVERARVEGMIDFIVTHHTHPFIMKAGDVIAQTLLFLREGRFDQDPP